MLEEHGREGGTREEERDVRGKRMKRGRREKDVRDEEGEGERKM